MLPAAHTSILSSSGSNHLKLLLGPLLHIPDMSNIITINLMFSCIEYISLKVFSFPVTIESLWTISEQILNLIGTHDAIGTKTRFWYKNEV